MMAINHHKKVITTDSVRNCIIMSFLRAPMAFLIPISLVLSVTDTIMIFITPIPPTKSEIAPIAPRKYVNTLIVDCKVSTKLAKELTENAA